MRTETIKQYHLRLVQGAIDTVRRMGDDPEADDRTVLIDLLANMMHWCEENGISFSDMAAMSVCHYDEESMEDAIDTAQYPVRTELHSNRCTDCSADLTDIPAHTVGCRILCYTCYTLDSGRFPS